MARTFFGYAPITLAAMIRRRMPIVLPPFEDRLRKAVAHYWRTLAAQSTKQNPGMDHGRRSSVTGGKQLDGFCELVHWVLRENGLGEASIYVRSDRELPGFFRPTKEWDMLVVHDGRTVAAIEFTSQRVPPLARDTSTRIEETIGMAECMWTAFRQEANGRSRLRPWLGWVMLVEDSTESGSYGKCYEQILHKFTNERLFDAAALIASPGKGGARGAFIEPAEDLSMKRLLASLIGWVGGYLAEVKSKTTRSCGISSSLSKRDVVGTDGTRPAKAAE
jgi:hypothetical protein